MFFYYSSKTKYKTVMLPSQNKLISQDSLYILKVLTLKFVFLIQFLKSNCCPFRSEQYFGSPSDTAAAAEGVRERLLLVEERRLQLQEAKIHNDEEEGVLRGQEARLDVIGEELSEKEEQEEEEGQQDEEYERAKQDC